MLAVLNAIAHFLVDAACVGALFSFTEDGALLGTAVLVYNTLAFSTQCLVGIALDKGIKQGRPRSDAMKLYAALESVSMFVVAAAAVAPVGIVLKAVLIGLGNSVFHVSAGSVTLERSKGKAAPLGVFVAPGAFGVTIGMLWPKANLWICAALGILSVFGYGLLGKAAVRGTEDGETFRCKTEGPGTVSYDASVIFPVMLLTAAVAVRAIGGTAAEFSWKDGAVSAMLLTLFVFLGKLLGGFVCDRLGVLKPSAVSVVLAALLTAFFAYSMPLSLAGQLLLNLSMPVTLWLMFKHIPDRPGLAFGLAASALWPGTLFGGLIALSGAWRSVLILICFIFSLGAIIYSDRVLNRRP